MMNKLRSKSGKLSQSSPAPPCGSVLHHRPWIMWVSKMQLLFRTFKTWRRFFSFWTCGPFPGWWLGWHPSASTLSLGTWVRTDVSSNTEKTQWKQFQQRKPKINSYLEYQLATRSPDHLPLVGLCVVGQPPAVGDALDHLEGWDKSETQEQG